MITLVLFAVPSVETTRKPEIIELFAIFAQYTGPISQQGLSGYLFYGVLVALWEGFSVLPIRYVEFLVALNYTSYFDFILIIVLGKTCGSILTYRLANYILSKEEMKQVFIATTNTFYFRALESLMADHPYLMSITIKIFFPSILASIGLALLLPDRNG